MVCCDSSPFLSFSLPVAGLGYAAINFLPAKHLSLLGRGRRTECDSQNALFLGGRGREAEAEWRADKGIAGS